MVHPLLVPRAAPGWILPTLLLPALLLAGQGLAAGESSDARLVELQGPAQPWSLTALADNQRYVFRDTAGHEVIRTADFVRWGSYRETGKGPQIFLNDGSMLVADLLRIDKQDLEVGIDFDKFGDANLWERLRLPRAAVRMCLLRPLRDSLQRDRQIDTLLGQQHVDDRLLLDSGDVLPGTLLAPPENGAASQEIWMRPVGAEQAIALSRSKITAILLGRATSRDLSAENPFVVWGFRDGSRIHVRHWKLEDQSVQITTGGGWKLSLPRSTLLRELVLILPLSDRFAYLSDLTPLDYKSFPYLSLTWPYYPDRNVLQGRLRYQDQVALKGIGMHATSRLAYELDGRFTRFQAELTLDQAAGDQGSVQFRVYLLPADSNAWKVAYRSPILRGGDAPLPLDLDIANARRLAIICEIADHGEQADYADWLDARLIREEKTED